MILRRTYSFTLGYGTRVIWILPFNVAQVNPLESIMVFKSWIALHWNCTIKPHHMLENKDHQLICIIATKASVSHLAPRPSKLSVTCSISTHRLYVHKTIFAYIKPHAFTEAWKLYDSSTFLLAGRCVTYIPLTAIVGVLSKLPSIYTFQTRSAFLLLWHQ